MATETLVAEELKLTAPEPVAVVAPEKAAGLVPLEDDKKTKLDESAPAPAHASNGASTETKAPGTAAEDSEKTNGGRAKKGFGKRAKKIAEQVVGKTARKTRSQGPA